MNHKYFWQFTTGLIILLIIISLITCGKNNNSHIAISGDVSAIAEARGLTPADVLAAVKTYTPTGKHDEYIMFGSGGHSGQALVIGIPSMRLLKVIAVFTPEPWQGWGYSKETKEILQTSYANEKQLNWGDTHHPALSETDGDYDGEYLFLNDKANARVAVIDLKDFETKQILKNPLSLSDHGGTFVTPNTEYVIEGGQYAMPWSGDYAPIEQFREKYRGMVTLWKFDRSAGRLDRDRSFAIELPPYFQDIADAGKLVSDGWIFINSFNSEMSTGGIEEGNPPFEAGASQRDMDYLHIINVKRAEELYKSGRTQKINGFNVLPLKVAASEGALFFVPEPKSPHGVDVSPDGNFIVIAGKLDPHVTIYNFEKIKAAIDQKKFDGTDSFDVPIINFDDALEAQVEVGLGPLHTQFDPNGYAYTSLFLESTVARWALGGNWTEKHNQQPWTMVDKISIHYNVGHVAAAEGDNVNPDGTYLVSLNKWSVDRFTSVGPLLPQNFQLIDISNTASGEMQLLYDMPVGLGEPHYAQIIKADKLKAWDVYPEVGWSPGKQAKDPNGIMPGEEKVEKRGNTVEIWMTAVRSHYNPERIEVKKGNKVIWHITNVERAKDATHGFGLPYYDFNLSIEPGETQTVEFTADKAGVFPFYCTEFCSALHLEMAGYFLVKPSF